MKLSVFTIKNVSTLMIGIVCGFSLQMLTFTAQAQNSETTEKIKKSPATSSANAAKDKRRQTIDFEDELIQGDVNKPELFYLLQKKQFNFKRLIKLREDFLPEMRRTSEEVQRSGGKN